MNSIKRKMGKLLNLVIIALGCLFIAFGIISSEDLTAQTIFLSIGTSLLASAIVSWLSSEYLIENERVKRVIENWQLSNLYQTKADMNEGESNKALEECSGSIDIVAEGMHNFLSVKGLVLRSKLKQGVKIRIISCDNQAMLDQRAKDESLTGKRGHTDTAGQVMELLHWVEQTRQEVQGCDISIRFHSSYPAYSYLKIDSKVFVSPNLWLLPSQQSIAFSFFEEGIGGKYFEQYFEQLWSSEFVHETCHLKEADSGKGEI